LSDNFNSSNQGGNTIGSAGGKRIAQKKLTKKEGDYKMTRTWARSELDMAILEKLYDYKSLRGTTIAKICTPYDLQKTHDRLHALMDLKKLDSKTYMEHDGRTDRIDIGRFKKRGQMYYLTNEGVTAVKEYRGLPTQDNERGVEVLDNQLKSLFTASLLIENLKLPFRSGRNYKLENELPNYITVDLVYENWLIFAERTQTKEYRKKQCQTIKGLKANPTIGDIMIICPNAAKTIITARTWKDELGPEVRIMSRDNMQGIEMLLKGRTQAEVIKAVSAHKGQVVELSQPEDGNTHRVDGKMCIIKDLIGFSPKVMRQITSSLHQDNKKYLVVEKATQLPYIVRRFSELLKPGHEFITLDGACETSENLQKAYGRKRKEQVCEN
jgi:hypothetical protein